MKLASLLCLIMITACSSKRIQEAIPPFQKEMVCSDEALTYLNKEKPLSKDKIKRYSPAEIHPRMLSLEPAIRTCYEEEMVRTNKNQSFNLCFVVGYNLKGKMDFFEFSTKEIHLTVEFKECLEKIKNRYELKEFTNLSIIQPFRLYPKN